MKKTLKTATYALAAIIPLIIILGCFRTLEFNTQFYYNEQNSNGVYEKIGSEQARSTTDGIISFLKTGKQIESKTLTSDEIKHLDDVRSLMKLSSTIFYILIALAISLAAFILIKDKKLILDSMLYGGIITAGITIALLFMITIAFDWSFIAFHKILFTNDLWLLPPESTLIRLFPTQLFIDFARKIGLNTMVISLVLIIIGKLKR